VSQDAFVLWKGGMKPPESAQLSAAAAGEVWRLRAWATAARAKAEQHVRVTALVRHVPEKRQKTVPAAAAAVRSPATFGEGAVTHARVQSVLAAQAGPSPQFDPAVLARVGLDQKRCSGRRVECLSP
jgi:hypothetical protein